jgi:restriction system protein
VSSYQIWPKGSRRKAHNFCSILAHSYFGPFNDALRSLGGSGTPDEVVERIAADLHLPDDLQNELLPSGESRYRNQGAWARFYLVREGLLESSKQGVWSLTERGRVTHLSLEQAREIRQKWVRVFQKDRKARAASAEPAIEQATEEGNAPREAGFTQVTVTGRSGDQGIDGYGTLQVNRLVSFRVLFQCKRYRESVSLSQVRDFRGAMAGACGQGNHNDNGHLHC